MINVAILGYGVVGSGVAEVLRKNSKSIAIKAGEEITVKKILDIRDFPDSPDAKVLTKNAAEVFDDASISIVVETIGGTRIAYEYTKKALELGKHVVTSNKELVATHGPELLKLARGKGVNYLFEASVGGGIPIIRPMNQCLAANVIDGITGILNGTTNYILSQMKREGRDFAEALKSAQQNGYAEADPTADIEGHDACRKIAILSSIAYNEFVDCHGIHTEGIKNISLADMYYADEMDSVIKLIGMSRKVGDRIYARVSPVLINKSNPLSNVEDVFNAIIVKGDAIGEAMFYGRGAGKLPTASAVVADIIDIVKHEGTPGGYLWERKEFSNLVDINEMEARYFVRTQAVNTEEAKKLIIKTFGEVEFISVNRPETAGELAFATKTAPEGKLRECVAALKGAGPISKVINVIRIED